MVRESEPRESRGAMSDPDAPSNQPYTYAERMFPAPVDLGIAQADRAVTSVSHGTRSGLEGQGGDGESWWQGGGSLHHDAGKNTRTCPPTRALVTQGDPFEPVKIGILIDMDLNQLLA